MRIPKGLPRVPEDEAVRRLLAACPDTFEGRRAKALIALLADSGLRVSEVLRLRIEDVRFATRTLVVRGGKDGKDRTGFFGAAAAQELRAWVQTRRDAHSEDFLFTDRQDRPLGRVHICHVIRRLSLRAGLSWKIGLHALRHYAATSILRQTRNLELVRQVLGHESLAMTLRQGSGRLEFRSSRSPARDSGFSPYSQSKTCRRRLSVVRIRIERGCINHHHRPRPGA